MSESQPKITPLPAPLQAKFEHCWSRFQEQLDEQQQQQVRTLFPPEGDRWLQLQRVLACSDYVAEQCIRNPQRLVAMVQSGELDRSYLATDLHEQLEDRLKSVATEEDLIRQLRLFRHQQQLRIIWRDLLRLADTLETTRDLSWMAQACIEQALAWLYEHACEKWGTPLSEIDGEWAKQKLVVLGMGKLGAHELNLSSDIDLMFAYEGKGQTRGTSKTLDNQQFFIRVAQRLIHVLDTRTADGFVFRVDMRLRPYGQSGALVLNFDAMSDYYQSQGRDWERYAMIKARVVAGDEAAGARLLKELQPFVYRRYLDFGAIDALRSMKQMISKEEERRGLHQDVKLGSGGIREIEFIAQVFQLIRGGHDTRLQQRSLVSTLATLVETGLIEEQDRLALYQAYLFLRNTEHALQAVRDEQTQQLPGDEFEQLRIAVAMGFSDWASFSRQLNLHRSQVRAQFKHLIRSPDNEQGNEYCDLLEYWQAIWQGEIEDEQARHYLEQQGFEDSVAALSAIRGLRENRKVQAISRVSHERLDAFMPRLLTAVARGPRPTQTLNRVLLLIEAVLRRTAYLVLLVENPTAMQQLIRLCAASLWIAEKLSVHPVLLDELLDARALYKPADPAALCDELRQMLLRIEPDDVEQQMECLRHFGHAYTLRVAASEVTEVLPLMKVSDYLTFIAEAVLQEVLQLAWNHMVTKYGEPGGCGEQGADQRFIIIAYGKLGGIELGYGSDLDLVFLHDAPVNGVTDGHKPIENAVFFIRLAQRIIHLLSTHTPAGQLYEVDMRLRPSGASGLLAISLQSFETYQQKQAWTWEHQALVRARAITGSAEMRGKFEQLRGKILSAPRDETQLKSQVLEMRGKICDAHALPSVSKNEFDLKYDPGGIVDIEFIVQYAVLAWSQNHPELLQYTDNIRILETLERLHLLDTADTCSLMEAYKAFRSVIHRLKLDEQPARLTATELSELGLEPLREDVMRIWRRIMLPMDTLT